MEQKFPKIKNFEKFKRFLYAKPRKKLWVEIPLKCTVFKNGKFDREKTRTNLLSILSTEDMYYIKVMNYFTEINGTLRNLHAIPSYMLSYPKRHPFIKDAGIKEHDYIIYHFENYFNEVYILRERIKAFLNFIKKKRFKGNNEIEKIIAKIILLMNNSLQNLLKKRGYHVHVERMPDEKRWVMYGLSLGAYPEVPAPDYSKLKAMYGLNLGANPTKKFKRAYKEAVELTTLIWLKEIYDFNKKIRETVNEVFEYILMLHSRKLLRRRA